NSHHLEQRKAAHVVPCLLFAHMLSKLLSLRACG
ncbi:MAG: hypothetical protein ACI9JM_000802, partial [Halioglobus sp.]